MLEASGLVIRTHGGAQLRSPIAYDENFENRFKSRAEAKQKIAIKAKELVRPDMVIGLSGGTTCTALARRLRMTRDITVVTNALNIAIELRGFPERRLMVTGGMTHRTSYELIGSLVAQSLQNVHMDLLFLGVVGFDPAFGCSVTDEPEASVARAFMAAAGRTVALADHSKICKATFARLCAPDEIDILITDDGISPAHLDLLSQTGIEVIVAGAP
jgi:DeoR family transcriptional regulator, aga operon transcriptional repressor